MSHFIEEVMFCISHALKNSVEEKNVTSFAGAILKTDSMKIQGVVVIT